MIAPAPGFEGWGLPPDDPSEPFGPASPGPANPAGTNGANASRSGVRWLSVREWSLALAIVLLGVAARLPVIGESFWVDELHSAWTVWADFSDVRTRAAMGNQTPLFYWGLWFWRQGVGDGEAALRMSSVLLSSLAAAIVAVGVTRATRSIIGGTAAGGMLVFESNAIFFGTELRAYASILPLAALACWCWLMARAGDTVTWPGASRPDQLRGTRAARQPRRAAAAAGMFTAVGLAGILQPMSLGVLVWLPLEWAWSWRGGWSERLAECWRDLEAKWGAAGRTAAVAVGVAIGLVGSWLAWEFAGQVWWEAWRYREQWKAFGSAHSPAQLFTVWPWTWMLILPVGLATLTRWLLEPADTEPLDRLGGVWAGWPEARWWGLPAAVAIGATLVYWLVSATGIAAVFHRRYLIAVLPLLAWAGGSAIGVACRAWSDRLGAGEPVGRREIGGRDLEFWWIALILFAGVLTIRPWVITGPGMSGPVRSLRLRGEDWRGAVEWVRDTASPTGRVWLSPALIETERWLQSGDERGIEYLAYPLSGPYRLEPVEIISLRTGRLPPLPERELEAGVPWHAVLRVSYGAAERWASDVVRQSDGRVAYQLQRFGGIQAIRFVPPAVPRTMQEPS